VAPAPRLTSLLWYVPRCRRTKKYKQNNSLQQLAAAGHNEYLCTTHGWELQVAGSNRVGYSWLGAFGINGVYLTKHRSDSIFRSYACSV